MHTAIDVDQERDCESIADRYQRQLDRKAGDINCVGRRVERGHATNPAELVKCNSAALRRGPLRQLAIARGSSSSGTVVTLVSARISTGIAVIVSATANTGGPFVHLVQAISAIVPQERPT